MEKRHAPERLTKIPVGEATISLALHTLISDGPFGICLPGQRKATRRQAGDNVNFSTLPKLHHDLIMAAEENPGVLPDAQPGRLARGT